MDDSVATERAPLDRRQLLEMTGAAAFRVAFAGLPDTRGRSAVAAGEH